MDSQYNQVRIIYAGAEALIHQLKQDFLNFGVPIHAQENSSTITIHKNLLKQFAPTLQSFPNIIINFYSDVYELAKNLPNFDADLIILDERIGEEAKTKSTTLNQPLNSKEVLHSYVQITEKKLNQEILFEYLKSAIEKFTPRDFNYTMRRIIVVLPKEAHKTDREFTLGVEQVRSIVIEPTSMVDLLIYATQGLFKFQQKHNKTSLCFSGGGLEGYLYSLGVANALNHCFINKKSCSMTEILHLIRKH